MPSNMYTARRSREMYTRRKMYTERRSREKLRVMRSRELSGCSQLAAVQSGVMVVAPFTASPGFALLDNLLVVQLPALILRPRLVRVVGGVDQPFQLQFVKD